MATGQELQYWATAVCADLGIDRGCCEVDGVLDLARDAAHAVMRPAAPLTTFLVGVAVGRGMPVDEAIARATRLTSEWGKGA
ncbi:DUF6457 domain-containing protein [Aestuariimicrobium sp. T2.26MG-19.2B]|uniref:DUF6457 domain-containing protein n=1 Tax=Aestuariimicrobium sp. T2.26MG-19.2B TaxID=3040679 RepID=UPI0024778C67|nr:DUF6457 domain-containing protein [Aestuariimicrobium sp. T2.26MG-19.2B]CAI9402249.1 hypothetical protein AESSP_00761 [Aestuariimicrobium sp. T2.26MG-19.2B]